MIYLVEDDRGIRELVVYTLDSVGLAARGFERSSEFWNAMKEELPALILLDIMLPEEDGLSILKKLRNAPDTKKIPIAMLTARDTEFDRVVGLDAGADDYIVKPFGMMELVARIHSLLRRAEMSVSDPLADSITIGKLSIDRERHVVKVSGNDISLTYKEFELLWLLCANRGIVYDRDTLLNKIWGYSFTGESRTVDVHIRSLRHKLGECGTLIQTVHGVGYKVPEAI